MPLDPAPLRSAADAIARADALLVTAGAGIGVDSGLPDFRGTDGFWRAYPAFAKLGLRFAELANPTWFTRDPQLAWGFYGHRLHLYRQTQPHPGFAILRRWATAKPAGSFVFTSNVDGQFHRAGFDPDGIVECHGSIHHLQCSHPCTGEIWPADTTDVRIDPDTMRATGPLPACPRCGAAARPNILMFGDGSWIDTRTEQQAARYHAWHRSLAGRTLAIVELGAGQAIPTVRMESERLARRHGTLVRINPRETDVPSGGVGLSGGALDVLRQLDSLIP